MQMLSRLVLVWLVMVAVAVAAEPMAPAAAPALKRGDAAGLYQALSDLLDSAEKLAGEGSLEERWQMLGKSRGYTLALAQAELIRATGVSNVQQVMGAPDGVAFMSELLTDREWLESYISSGPFPQNTPDGLETLRQIWRSDRDADAAKYRRIATAVALVFNTEPMKGRLVGVTTRSKDPVTPLNRYAFYKRSQQAGLLRRSFNTLAVWELRWVVSAPVENEALEWLQKSVNMPLEDFHAACWIPRYRGVNNFGNTIQGPLFYAPSRASNNWAEDVAKNGGVCGALSTFGAYKAMARGVPATTKGQPGHCAYAYRVAPGDWVAAFGGPDGGAHYHFWQDRFSWVWLADDAFTAYEKLLESNRLAWWGRRVGESSGVLEFLSSGAGHRSEGGMDRARAGARGSQGEGMDRARAGARGSQEGGMDLEGSMGGRLGVLRLATKAQPLNWDVWQERIELSLHESGKLGKSGWLMLVDDLLRGMAQHPQPMCALLNEFDEKALYPLLSVDERREIFKRVHDIVARNHRQGWTPWDMPKDLFERQLKALEGGDPTEFFSRTLASYCNNPHEYFLGQMIDWGSKKMTKSSESRDAFVKALGSALASGEGQMDDKLYESTLKSAIRAAEEARSVEGFQLLSDSAARFSGNGGDFNLESPAGAKLVSGGGLLYLQGGDNWDNPVSHRNVLREIGGGFHTSYKDGKTPFVVVQLPQSTVLSDIIVVNRHGNRSRCNGLNIYHSSDHNTWHLLEEVRDFKMRHHIDLRGKNIRAQWIKVEDGSDNTEPFHLRNICVYGE